MKEGGNRTGNWLTDQGADNAEVRAYGEELAIASGAEAIARAMESSGITRAALAERLGCHKSFVTRVLSGPQNMTLATMGAFLWGCGYEVKSIDTEPLGTQEFVEEPIKVEVTVQAVDQFVASWEAVPSFTEFFANEVVERDTAPNNLALVA
ncbi:MAG: helix-turn-helix domain-containing protein [Gemmatimonadaceae bacterium]